MDFLQSLLGNIFGFGQTANNNINNDSPWWEQMAGKAKSVDTPPSTDKVTETGLSSLLGENGWLNTGMKGLGVLGDIWGANKQYKMVKDQFNFQKDMANANLDNSIQSYNTRLKDRARSRAAYEGQSDQERDNYINENKLTR